jgi:hypothetical protein
MDALKFHIPHLYMSFRAFMPQACLYYGDAVHRPQLTVQVTKHHMSVETVQSMTATSKPHATAEV